MRSIMMATLAAGACTASAMGQWWWPPTNGLSVSPSCPSPSVSIQLTVGGQWPDNCVPNGATATLSSPNVIDFVTERNPPPGICLTVITNWQISRSVGPLPPGVYNVYVTHTVSGTVVHPRTLVGSFEVSPSCPGGCYPDCNADGVLNLSDFGCFQTRFALGDPWADCNADGVLNLSDFGCFQTRFALGCP